MTTIIVTHEDNEVDEFEFESGHEVIKIGRRSDNDVAIPNLSVSGKHAIIRVEGGQAVLEDLNSTNGTYINGEIVKQKVVRSGDEIILGKIRLSIILPKADSAVSAIEAADDIAEPGAEEGHDNSMDSSLRSRKDASEPADSDEWSFEEDVRLFAQSASEPATSDDNDALVNEANAPQEQDNLDSPLNSDDDGAFYAANTVGDEENAGTAQKTAKEQEKALHSGPVSDKLNTPNLATVSQHADPHKLDGIASRPLQENDDDAPPMHELDSPSVKSNGAVIEIKNGAKSGQILPIDKPVTTLGRPGIQIAAIMRKPDGYFLMHIESDDSVERPTLNQDSIGDEPVLLHSGDELNVAGIDVEFMLS